MPFEKGQLKKGGREKGTTNKDNLEIKDAFKRLLEDNSDNISIWLDRVAETDPHKALEIITKYAEYVLPKLNRTTLAGDSKDPIQFTEVKNYKKSK